MDVMNLLYAYGYAIVSFVVVMFFPWIHMWWAYEKFAAGEFYKLEGFKKWVWFYYIAVIEPRKAQMMNLNYAIVLACTQTLISRWFEATSANTIFWWLFAPNIFDYDWE